MRQITMADKYALDTNILIYLEGNDFDKRKTAELLLSYDPVIPTQVVSEFINVIFFIPKICNIIWL
jgi:predicted nucleic acid-binding protein